LNWSAEKMADLLETEISAEKEPLDLRESIYRKIKQSILDGDIMRGSWLQEDQVCKVLSASRTPVREVFNRLRGEGLLEIFPRKGARIIDMSGTQVDALYEARALIELAYFEKSATVFTSKDYEQFLNELRNFEEKYLNTPENSEKWEELRKVFSHWDRIFHDKLLIACGNEYWIKIYFQIRDLIIISSNGRSFAKESFDGAIQEHHQILDALCDGRYAEARKLLAEHILNTRRYDEMHLRRQRIKSMFSATEESL
jgi:DNA-binding GntR family transcriptional regulator